MSETMKKNNGHSPTFVYNTDEWKSLDGLDRAQLLLVIEGLKRGTIIGGNWSSFIEVIGKFGLEYELTTHKHRLDMVAMVARPETFKQYTNMLLTMPEESDASQFHKATGWFLSYPECCTEEYNKKMTPEEKRALASGPHHRSYKFGRELEEKIMKDGTYPDVFDYRPPSFTPCGIGCSNAIRALKEWKDAIDRLDPEAAEELVYFNRQSYPERLAHEEYIKERFRQMVLEDRLYFLRMTLK
jgi:hypothetical protein